MLTRPSCVCAILMFIVFPTGCSQNTFENLTTTDQAVQSGKVTGGGQPIANAKIQLYSIGTAGDGSGATPLLSKAIVTDQMGKFDLMGLYSCKGANMVYVTATGGRAGLDVNNPAIALMTALGACSPLSSQTSIEINELTTIAATNALVNFMGSAGQVGSGVLDNASLKSGFQLAAELVDTTTGLPPGPGVPNGFSVPVQTMDTLANVVAECVNSTGGVAGDGSACGNFFTLTTDPDGLPPTSTIAALHNLALYPGLNSGSLFNLTSAQPAFKPILTEAPSTFAISLVPADVDGALVLTPNEMFFKTPVGSTSSVQSFTLQNTGEVPVTLSSIELSGVDANDFTQTNNCPGTLAAGISCHIDTVFSPWDASQRSAALEINSSGLSAALFGQSSLPNWEETLYAAEPSVYLNFNEPNGNYRDHVGNATFSKFGSLSPAQPGFDDTDQRNKSAALTANSYLVTNDTTTGDFEWKQPFTILFHVDDLQYPQDGTMYLLSKGNVGGGYSTSWYELGIEMNQGIPQMCFMVSGAGADVAPHNIRQTVCTRAGITAIPNGYNYDIIVSNDGTGSPDAFRLYLNGVEDGSVKTNYGYHFGAVVTTIGGVGMGYADTTLFASIGGGSTCVVTGMMTATGGAPTGIIYTKNWGCASAPLLSLTSPAGSGVTLNATLFGGTLTTSKTDPLIIGGAEVNGTIEGMDVTQAASAQQKIDEFAMFPRVLNARIIGTLSWETKFYQRLLDRRPALPKKVVFDNDGCADTDNLYALALAIGAQHLGYIELVGVVDSDANGASTAVYRQMLDQAGLVRVPLSVPSKLATRSSGPCLAANVQKYDQATGSTTEQSTRNYESAAGMYRRVLASNANAPVYIILGGSFRGVADLMQSPADDISTLTGSELTARDAANGAAIYAQGLAPNITFSGDNSLEDWAAGQYVVEHNGQLPILWHGGAPQVSGPGVLSTRTTIDPLFLAAFSAGTDVRQAFDSLPTATFLSSQFVKGRHVQIGGSGSGYAESTYFTSLGGGDRCSVEGVMHSNGGIPTSVQGNYYYSSEGYTGLGEGCASTPTLELLSSVGSGVVLSSSPTAVCGTVSIAGPHSGTTSTTTCSQHYFLPYSSLADPANPQILQWFINSIIDPSPER